MTTFAGLEIHGSIYAGDKAPEQRTQEEFNELIDRVLSFDEVAELTWRQYTPYFNDGDACVFGVSPYVGKYDQDDEEDHDEAFLRLIDGRWIGDWAGDFHCGGYGAYEYPIGRKEYSWGTDADCKRVKVYSPYEGPNEPLFNAVSELHSELDKGRFNNVLIGLFGDHAEVTIKKNDGIYIEEYVHD